MYVHSAATEPSRDDISHPIPVRPERRFLFFFFFFPGLDSRAESCFSVGNAFPSNRKEHTTPGQASHRIAHDHALLPGPWIWFL